MISNLSVLILFWFLKTTGGVHVLLKGMAKLGGPLNVHNCKIPIKHWTIHVTMDLIVILLDYCD